MKKRLWYVLIFVLLLAGLFGPALLANKFHGTQPGNKPAVATATRASSRVKPPEPKQSPVKGEVKVSANTGGAGSTSGKANNAASTGQNVTPAPKEEPADEYAVSIAVVGKDGHILYGPGSVTLLSKNSQWGLTAMGALAATGLPYEMSSAWAGFVQSVAGEQNSGMSGWMYEVDGKVVSVAATEEPVKDGDKIIWWYSKGMGSPPPDWDNLVQK